MLNVEHDANKFGFNYLIVDLSFSSLRLSSFFFFFSIVFWFRCIKQSLDIQHLNRFDSVDPFKTTVALNPHLFAICKSIDWCDTKLRNTLTLFNVSLIYSLIKINSNFHFEILYFAERTIHSLAVSSEWQIATCNKFCVLRQSQLGKGKGHPTDSNHFKHFFLFAKCSNCN